MLHVVIHSTDIEFCLFHPRSQGDGLGREIESTVGVIGQLDGDVGVLGRGSAYGSHDSLESCTFAYGVGTDIKLKVGHVIVIEKRDDLSLVVVVGYGIEGYAPLNVGNVVVHRLDLDVCLKLTRRDGDGGWE